MKHIILLYEELIPSVRLCGYEQLTYLAKQGKLSFEAMQLRSVKRRELKRADAVIFVRGDSDFECTLAKKLAQAGKYLIYVLDDDLLNVPPYLASYSHYAAASAQKNIKTLMAYCHCLLTPSERLAQKYGAQFDRIILIEEPALCSKRQEKSGEVIRIGFAGSIDRTQDLEQILAQPLRNIRKKYGDRVAIEFFGTNPNIAQELGCRHYPYAQDYAAYRETMESLCWDIGLAPMPNTAFHACKHYNKFIEYGSFGIISICSALPPYDRVVRNWENGVLCPNEPEVWEAALSRLIEDAQLRKRIQKTLYWQICSSFQVSQTAENLWKQLDRHIPILKRHTLGWVLANKIQWRAMWILTKIRRYGWRLPLVALKKLTDRFNRNEGRK